MPWTAPTVVQFKTQFNRDFNYAPSNDANNLDYITNTDIQNAINEALVNFTDLYDGGTNTTIVFLYLAAFFMVFNLQNSAKGISSQSRFPISSNSVGGVSVNYQLPERYTSDPVLSMYTQNGYGMKFLSLALPYTIGNVGTSLGTTTFA